MDRHQTIDATTDSAMAHDHDTVRIYGGLGIYCPTCHANKVGAGPWRKLSPVITEQA